MCEACYGSLEERKKAGKERDQNYLTRNKHGKIEGNMAIGCQPSLNKWLVSVPV